MDNLTKDLEPLIDPAPPIPAEQSPAKKVTEQIWFKDYDPSTARRHITFEETLEIAEALEDGHALFKTFWDLGSPKLIVDKSLPTACIAFDQRGQETAFLWNSAYFEYLQPYERAFIAGHEMLHVIFDHGKRMLAQRYNELSNMAMDVVVNHTLCEKFGFDRTKIRNWENLCWVDTCFPEEKFGIIPNDKSYEYYYNLMVENTNIVEIKILVDCHGVGDNSDSGGNPGGEGCQETEKYSFNDHESIGKDLSKYLSHEDFDKTIKDSMNDHGHQPASGQQAGRGIGQWMSLTPPKKLRVNKKWEDVIKKWKKKTLVYDTNDFESFIKENRRFMEFLGDDDDLALATDVETEDWFYDKRAVNIWFYLDVSGSCISFKDRFFHASQTLDKNKFKVKLFSFDTAIREVDLVKKNIYGGGGTAFNIIEDHILSNSDEYPDVVFVITDGHGNNVAPRFPERWHWFLTENPKTYGSSGTAYIPKESKIHILSDYEAH